MAAPPPHPRSPRSTSPSRQAYLFWLLGLGLGEVIAGATLMAFTVPSAIWGVALFATTAMAIGWLAWGFLGLAIALTVGINWTVDSGLGVVAEVGLTTLVGVMMAGTIGILAGEARQQLLARFQQPKWRPILLLVSYLGWGLGALLGLGLLSVME